MNIKDISRIAIPAFAALFFGVALIQHWDQLKSLNLGHKLVAAGITLPLLTGIFLTDAYGWHLILRSIGAKITAANSISIWYISAFARYIPGVIWTYLSRIQKTNELGVSTRTCISSVILESFLLAFSALICSFPIAASYFDLKTSVLLYALGVALFFIILSRQSVILVLRKLKYKSRIANSLRRFKTPKTHQLALLTAFYIVFSLVFASTFLWFSSILINLEDMSNQELAIIACSFPLSFALGFIVSISPGGLGIREGAMYAILIQTIPPAEALTLSLATRGWLITGELIGAALVFAKLKLA